MRWRHIAYIPQGAMNVLSPVTRIEKQILDAMFEHSDMSKEEARTRMFECLEMVGLESTVARMYPHELSGGMKQRVTIAAAISLKPGLIIADEPTTALDVNVQQVILQELMDIAKSMGLTLIYVTHDMAVHAEMADRMGIMYSGLIVEVAPVIDTFKEPLHPYTLGIDLFHSRHWWRSHTYGGDSRQCPEPAGLAVGLPVPSALSQGDGNMPYEMYLRCWR